MMRTPDFKRNFETASSEVLIKMCDFDAVEVLSQSAALAQGAYTFLLIIASFLVAIFGDREEGRTIEEYLELKKQASLNQLQKREIDLDVTKAQLGTVSEKLKPAGGSPAPSAPARPPVGFPGAPQMPNQPGMPPFGAVPPGMGFPGGPGF
uniref:Uncharacterized protein n=1 Tax=Hemiselmis tepida TaxID=464990 RepID=A0A7S0V2H8_9CRYP